MSHNIYWVCSTRLTLLIHLFSKLCLSVLTAHFDLFLLGDILPVIPQDMSENSGQQQLLVKARFNFQQTNEDELTFTKGDILSVTRQEDGGWWEGTLNGRTGWFPSNYVRELKGTGRGVECCVTSYMSNYIILNRSFSPVCEWSQSSLTDWLIFQTGVFKSLSDINCQGLHCVTVAVVIAIPSGAMMVTLSHICCFSSPAVFVFETF